MGTIERLRVELGARGYDILVGPQLIERAGLEILPLMRRRQAVIVSDEIVAGYCLAALRDSLSEVGTAHHTVLLPPGEETKDLAHFGRSAVVLSVTSPASPRRHCCVASILCRSQRPFWLRSTARSAARPGSTHPSA